MSEKTLAAAPLRALILEFIELCKEAGATCDEVEEILDLRHQSCSARVHELARDGFIVDSGLKRKTRSGRPARVYVAKED